MLTINIVCVGKLKESYLREACAEYIKRLGVFCKLNVIELNESRIGENPQPSEIDRVIQAEGKAILSKITGQSHVFAMCIEGQQLCSEGLSEKVEQIALRGVSTIVFVIGGSYGLADQVKLRADFKLSMSKMTFPHQLARVMLLEQVYRACSISAHTKYHK